MNIRVIWKINWMKYREENMNEKNYAMNVILQLKQWLKKQIINHQILR